MQLKQIKEDLGTYETLPQNMFLVLTLGSYKLEVNDIRPPALPHCKVNNAFQLFLKLFSCKLIHKRNTQEPTQFVSVRLPQVDKVIFNAVVGFV